jgi:putative transposase
MCSARSVFLDLEPERTNRSEIRRETQLEQIFFDYIERFYNPLGRHSTLDDLTPINYEILRVAGERRCHPDR